MLKRRLVSILTSLTVIGSLIAIPQVNAENAAETAKFYQFDFNDQSLEATTSGGGSANSLKRADSNTDFKQEWGDGTIKFDKDLTQQQYYQLETPVTLAKNKEWLVEFRTIFAFDDSGNQHSAIISQGNNNSDPWIWFNGSTGSFRLSGASTTDGFRGITRAGKMYTYMLKNIPNEDNHFHVYFSYDGVTWHEYNDEETNFTDEDMTVNYMFGPGWGVATNFKGEMDYIKLYEDLGNTNIQSIEGCKLNTAGGSGTAADPYIANVTFPYSQKSISKSSIDSIAAVNLTLYTDKFVTAADTIDTSSSAQQKIYLCADGSYYEINADFKVDLTKDSGLYKFDFNGSLNTSAGGLENSLVVTGEDTDHSVQYINGNTEINVANEVNGDLGGKTTSDNWNNSKNPTVIYSFEKPFTLSSEKNWKISTRLRPRFKSSVLLGDGSTGTNRFEVWDWYLVDATPSRNRISSYTIGNNYQVIEMKNEYDSANNKSTLITDIATENSKKDTSHNKLDITGMNHTLKYMFSANTLWGFGGYVDYMYIDADTDKTAAMEFLAKYEDVIASGVSDDVISLSNDYSALSAEAKANITRGETAVIENVIDSSTGISAFAGEEISVTGDGTADSPYTANVNVPYSIASITADMFEGVYTDFNLYADSSFAVPADKIETTNAKNIVFYAKANNKYYCFNGTYAVNLAYDSGAYKFGFNNSLESSGLKNSLTRADSNTDVEQKWGDGTIKFDQNEKDQYYSLEKTATLAHDKPWAIEWRGLRTNENGLSILFLQDNNVNVALHGHELRINYKDKNFISAKSSNMDSGRFVTYRIENNPDADGNADIHVFADGIDAADRTSWVGDTTDYSKTSDIEMKYLFGGRGVTAWNYLGEMDYFNIDLDPDKTAAMEFLARYANIISNGIADMPNTAVAAMVTAYNNLSQTSKSYFVRGENDAMTSIINGLEVTVEMTMDNTASNVIITAMGAEVKGAKLLICRYDSDKNLENVEIKDVDLNSNSNGTYSIGDYSAAHSVKAILLENLNTLYPLANYLDIK